MDLGKHHSGKKGNKGGHERRPFLKAADLPKKGNLTVTIEEVREAPKAMQYSDLLCDLSNGTKKWTWGLRAGFTLDALIDKFGKNSDKWKGKKLTLTKGGDRGQYINVAQ